MEHDPQKLDYQSPGHPYAQRGRRSARGMYGLGVFSGFAVSLVYYLSLGTDVGSHSPAAPLGAVIFKMIVGTVFLFLPKWRALGLGLITSIPIAILIFLGLCFGILALN